MDPRRQFDQAQNAAPTMAAPAASPQQAPYGGGYPPYGHPPPDYGQQAPYYGQSGPAPQPAAVQLPMYKRPGVVFGAAAVAAVIAVGALLGTWVSKDDVSTTPVNNTGIPTQPAPVLLVPAPPSAPPPSQSVVVQQPAPRSVPRQQAPAPRVAPANPSAVNPAPVSPAPVSPAPVSPVPDPNQNQNPPPVDKQDPGDVKDPNTGADTRGKVDPPPVNHNPGDPENPTADDTLCHPNPPGCAPKQAP